MTRTKNIDDHTTPDPTLSPAATPETTLLFKIDATDGRNIKFVGRDVYDKGKRKILRVVDPIETFSDGGEIVELPPADFQKRRRLFYHEAADLIASTFPNLYKLVTPRRSVK